MPKSMQYMWILSRNVILITQNRDISALKELARAVGIDALIELARAVGIDNYLCDV